MGGPLPKLVAK